jgi:ATP-dependent DNA ligase
MSLDRFERQPRSPVLLYAFDLIELNGDDMRRDPLEVRKATLRSMLAESGLGSRFNVPANRAKCWPSPEACLRTSQNAGNAPNMGTTDS